MTAKTPRLPAVPVIGHPDKPRRAQLDLFGPPSLAPDKLATAIARIGAVRQAGIASGPWRLAEVH